jgi:hypothetical protein
MSFPLTDDERAQLSARADSFHAALVRGEVGDWRHYLDGVSDRVRAALLPELVIIDLVRRWDRGERPEVEEYVRRFPDFGPADRVPAAVILEECRCRVKAGEVLDTAAYQSRFPTQFPAVRRELELLRGTVDEGGKTITRIDPPDWGPEKPTATSGVVGDYHLVRELGRGQFGVVWLARKEPSGIEKAIKVITRNADPGGADRERRALELVKNLRHPFLLAIDDFWEADGKLHIVMELAEGTLRNRLEWFRDSDPPGIPVPELLGYLWEAAEVLDFLHARSVVHRDVKPDNILRLNGHAKVADFGLARLQEGAIDLMRTFAGTPIYMAPEVWGQEVGPASDQYSLAATYVELRQGKPVVRGRVIEDVMIAHRDGSHDLAGFIGPAERAVLARAMARHPGDRHPSCVAFVEALAEALGRGQRPRPSAATPGPPPEPKPVRTVAADSAARRLTRTASGRDAVADAGPAPGPASPEPVRWWKPGFVGVLTVGFFAALGTGIWLAVRNPGTPDTAGSATQLKGEHVTGQQTKDDPKKDDPKKDDPKKDDPKPPPKFLPPDPTPQVLPPGAVRDPGAREIVLADGRRVFERVAVPVGGEVVRFRLIPGGDGPRPVESFYLMESKVWNGLYRAGGKTPPPGSDGNGAGAPVTHLTADEAAAFARGALGGRLPTPDEWDQAAGFFSNLGRPEVTRPGGRPRVLLKAPQPTHGPDAGTDINEFGLRDMAGNGREWTRAVLTKPGESAKEVGTSPLTETDLVVLRGRNFTLSRGLTFEMLEYEQTTPQTQFATARSPYTTFRVALPVPGK